MLSDKQPEPDPGFVTLDEDFHVRLAAASGNPSLADLLRIVNERIRVVRMHDFLTAERVGGRSRNISRSSMRCWPGTSPRPWPASVATWANPWR